MNEARGGHDQADRLPAVPDCNEVSEGNLEHSSRMLTLQQWTLRN